MRYTHFPPLILVILAALLTFGGFVLGRQVDERSAAPAGRPTTSSVTDQTDFGLFWEVWQKLHTTYFGPLTNPDLVEGAVRGLIDAAGDPYTVYLDPQAAKELGEGLHGAFTGIGAEIGVKGDELVIIAPLTDSPAAAAGLKPQDEILKIGDEIAGDLSFVEAVRAIRGPDGSTVELTILRPGEEEPRTVAVTRSTITVKSVASEIIEDKVGYLKISAFHEDTSPLVQTALTEFVNQGVTGIVLDLRGNPGGLLHEGIAVASFFLETGPVVIQQDASGDQQTFDLSRQAKVPKLPLVTLVDEGTASAAEIVAGAIQDHERGPLVGQLTFGKGSVQELIDLSNLGQIKVTVAKWLTPDSRQIDGIGITPDLVVADDLTTDADEQLAAAVEKLENHHSTS